MTAVVLRGDAAHLPLPDESVDLVVTSPPYFGLRSYTDGGSHYSGQIGSEATPAEYVAALIECTRDWVRCLKPSGSMFINLGDRYAGGGMGGHKGGSIVASQHDYHDRQYVAQPGIGTAKSLIGLPWRYALACIDQLGLILRAEIIWSKPNGLPESVTDRVRRSHEEVFHFTRLPRYYSAVDEVREPAAYPDDLRHLRGGRRSINPDGSPGGGNTSTCNPLGKLPGSVWDIPSQPLTVPPSLGVDHFAAFPMELPRRIILGWSPPGVCTGCGEGRRPVTILHHQRPAGDWNPLRAIENRPVTNARPSFAGTITGYRCFCTQPSEMPPTRPAVVLDPFGGTGTTALIASTLGRTGITVDRSADYCRLARWRTTDPGQRAAAMQVPKPPAQLDGQDTLFAVL